MSKTKEFFTEVQEVIETHGEYTAELHIVETYDFTPAEAREIIAQVIARTKETK